MEYLTIGKLITISQAAAATITLYNSDSEFTQWFAEKSQELRLVLCRELNVSTRELFRLPPQTRIGKESTKILSEIVERFRKRYHR